MTVTKEISCPVCRAKQEAQASCRRCNADLTLYVKALNSFQLAEQLQDQALEHRDQSLLETTDDYLNWLKPNR